MRRLKRLLTISAVTALAIVALVVIALHTGPAQTRILQWSIGELERRFDLDLIADDLSFNLVTLRVVMANVRLAAVGHRDDPFFTAESVEVRLPWSVYRGRLSYDQVVVNGGHVTITRDPSGLSNLPPGRGRRDPNAPPRRVDARAVLVRQLDFIYRDLQRDIEITTPRIRTDLTYVAGQGAKGPLAIDGTIAVRVKQRRVDIKPLSGTMVFDSSGVELSGITLDTTDGLFGLSGRITRALDTPTLDLHFKGTTEIAQSSRWAPPPIHVAGPAAIEATMKGAPTQFVLEAHVTSPGIEVGTERGVAIDADARLTPSAIAVSRSTIKPATGGEIHATVDVPFGAQSPWWIQSDWQGLDAASAFRLAEVRVLPFGAALTGTARFDRAPGEPFRLEAHNRSTPRFVQGTAPLEGEVEFFIDGSRWRANQRHRLGAARVDGRIGGVWNRAAASRSTFDGDITLATTDIGETARHAALFGLKAPALVNNTTGPLDATAKMGGIFTSPRFVGSARTTGANVPSIGRAGFTADFDISPDLVTVRNLVATITPTSGPGAGGSADVRGEVTADLLSRALRGSLVLDAASAADLFPAAPRALQLEGPLAATATLGGTVDRPDISAELKSGELKVAGQPVDGLTVKSHVIDSAIVVDSIVLRQGAGELRGSGRYDWNARTYTADIDGQRLTWRGTLPRRSFGAGELPPTDVTAAIALKFAGSGSIDSPAGEGVIDFEVSGGPAGELIDRGIINVRLNGDDALVTGRIPSLGAFITAHVQPRQPFGYDAVIVMNRIDLDPVIAIAGLQAGFVTGTASLSALARGTLSAPADSTVFINLQDIQADVSGVPLQLASPSRLSWDHGLTIDTLDLAVGKGRLLASGRLAEGGLENARWQATFKGELGDVLTIGRPFGVPEQLTASGTVDLNWQSTGGLDRSTATMHLADGSVSWANLPALAGLVMDATFNGATLDVTKLTGMWQEGSLEGSASIPRDLLMSRAATSTPGAVQTGFAKLRIVGLTENAFAPWLSASALTSIDGRTSASLDLRITSATVEGLTGSLSLDEADFTIAGVRVAQLRPSVLEIATGLVTARDVTFEAGGSPLTLTGTARIAPRDKQALDLTLRGTANLRLIAAVAPTLATDGEARINMGIGGPLDAPVFNGRIDIVGAELAIREPRLLVSELNGTIALDGRRVVFDSLKGSLNGGELTLDGGFLLEGFRATAGGLTAQIQRAAVEYPAGLQSEADALVTLRPGPPGWNLSGDVRVERSVYNETLSLPALLAARRSRPPAAGRDASWAEELRLNLFLFTQQDLRLDNNYGRVEAGAALRVSGTVANPSLSGRVTLREGGEVYLAGNRFYVTRGSISFANPNRILPEFDIELRTVVSGRDVTLTLEGPLDRLETDVRSSDPTLDSREAMSLIFGQFQGEDAVALLSAELLGVTGRAIGLDTLRVERGFETDEFRADPGLVATDVDPSTRLTLSKRLRPDVELVLSQSLNESGGLSAIISYKPRRNIELRAVSRDNVDRSFALRHEITFGGSTSGAGAAPPKPATVSAVTISGEPGRPTAELMALLKLEVGEAFTFKDWQTDLDALRADYHDRRYYEVRIRGARQPSEDDTTVALDYRIEPGPVAELVLEGHPLEPDIERDIREAWMRTIFDRFLLEDIRTRITRHLLEEEYVGSSVEAAVTVATPERKEIRVSVKAGPRVSRRTVRYIGARAFDADRLDGVIQTGALDIDGWLHPERFAEAIQQFYRSQGYLAATVTASEPRVEGNEGVLDVTIAEGARYRIASLTLPGVSPATQPAVAAAIRLDSGVPFVNDELDAAAERVEQYYALQGFNSVQLEIRTTPHDDAQTVDISVAVLEGLQQILRAVSTEGATRTREGVILRALRLRVGEPVNLAAWSQARKRLYDTNVFRQVDIEPVPMEPTTEDSAAGIQPVRAVVRVVEYPVWRLRYGLQFNDERDDFVDPIDGASGRTQSIGILTDLQNQNFLGRAVTAGIAGRYERNRQAGSLFTSNSSFFGLPIRSSGFIFASRQRFTTESVVTIEERVGLTAEQRWRPFRTSEVIWSYRAERFRVFDPNLPENEIEFLPFNVSRVNAAMVLDRRDDPSDPTKGWFSAANWEQAVEALGSDYGNAKLLAQQSLYRKLGGIVLAGRAQVGSAFGDQELQLSERFQLGGATTVRGYSENSIGPRDVFGQPAGGDALLTLNAEMRFPVRGWVQGVAFVDGGNVFRTRDDFSFRDIAVGYGFGLRLATPFAMLRADFGIPARTITPDRPANQFKSGRVYFGIGHIF